jgi:HEAT repeat protein
VDALGAETVGQWRVMLPIPSSPPEGMKPHTGQLSEYFAEYPTEDLVDLLRQMGPPDDLCLDSKHAHDEGKASYGDILIALHERATRDVFDEASALCADPDPRQRITGLWLLREIGPTDHRPVYEETWNVLDRMASKEQDIEVLRWVVMCFGFTCNPAALDPLVSFSTHPAPEIRESVAFHIVGCSDANDPRMVEVQLRLCGDEAVQVRRYAAYDFANDISADTPEIRRTLKSLLNDDDELVRDSAVEALASRG